MVEILATKPNPVLDTLIWIKVTNTVNFNNIKSQVRDLKTNYISFYLQHTYLKSPTHLFCRIVVFIVDT